jgi:tetratricopeptide (TPR) repeat protein
MLESGWLDEAAELYHRAMAIISKADSPDMAAVLSDLGVIELHGDRYRAAQRLFERALSIQEDPRQKHPDISITLNNLASCALKQNQPAHATAFYARALAIVRASVGRARGSNCLRHVAGPLSAWVFFGSGTKPCKPFISRRRRIAAASPLWRPSAVLSFISIAKAGHGAGTRDCILPTNLPDSTG